MMWYNQWNKIFTSLTHYKYHKSLIFLQKYFIPKNSNNFTYCSLIGTMMKSLLKRSTCFVHFFTRAWRLSGRLKNITKGNKESMTLLIKLFQYYQNSVSNREIFICGCLPGIKTYISLKQTVRRMRRKGKGWRKSIKVLLCKIAVSVLPAVFTENVGFFLTVDKATAKFSWPRVSQFCFIEEQSTLVSFFVSYNDMPTFHCCSATPIWCQLTSFKTPSTPCAPIWCQLTSFNSLSPQLKTTFGRRAIF